MACTFFDISASKSGPNLVCFVHFDLEMCFAPQRRALFRHLTFQKWSDNGVFCTFWLGNVLRATTACTFSTSHLPKVVRQWCVLYILTWKCASRHNGVHFFDISTSKSGPMCVLYILTSKCASCYNGVQLFISHLARWLRTRRFSEPTFGPSGATNHWINTVFRDFPTFSRICIFFLLTLSLLWSSLFYSSLPSDSSHLCFSSVHIVGSLTSKLPSIMEWFYLEIYHKLECPIGFVSGSTFSHLPDPACASECRRLASSLECTNSCNVLWPSVAQIAKCSSLSKWHLSPTGFCKVSADFETTWVIGAAHPSKHESQSGSSSTTCWELTYIWTLDWRSHPRVLLGWTLHVDQVLSVSTLTATSCREFSQERQVHLRELLYGSMGWDQWDECSLWN